jgi:hypothetical protein
MVGRAEPASHVRRSFALHRYWLDLSGADLEHRAMEETVARLNIEHYRKLLAEEKDETKRRTLHSLLAEEEAKLAALMGALNRKRQSR